MRRFRGTSPSIAAVLLALLLLLPAAAHANAVSDENLLPGGTTWGAKEPPIGEVAAYAEASVAPGDTLHLHIASNVSYRVEVWRLGWYGGKGGRQVACEPVDCSDQPP